MQKIFIPTIEAMKTEGREFRGCLYFGLMLTEDGPKVIEYNCRFGDPETQVVLPLLESDLLEVMMATTEGRLSECSVEFSKGAAACVIMASAGYPDSYKSGYEISIDPTVKDAVYVAGAKLDGQRLLSAGGRVLGVTATAPDLKSALDLAYERVGKVSFENAYYRHDIGARALRAKKG